MGRSGDIAQLPTWAVTKFRAPSLRDQVVVRSRLSNVFDQAVDSGDSLVLVSAPAGSGKSTAVASWIDQRSDLDVVWVQAEEADNDPARFWSALVTGLAQSHPEIGETVGPLVRTPKAGFVESTLPALINSLDDLSKAVVVLDDYHLIVNERLHADVGAFLDAAPSDLTLVISTRLDPPLRLGRLRVRGQLREIRAADLRFEPAEASTFFAYTPATPTEIEILCERTEGWAAGLVLAATSLSRAEDPATFVKDFAGDNRLVVDYLSTELWDGLSEAARNLFLRISILDKMCGPLVDAVIGAEDKGTTWLETAARDNQLIVSLDEHSNWYRYHHLLQDLLQRQLARTKSEEIPGLHARAARWFASHGDEESAIQHALAAGEIGLAAELIGEHGSHTFSEGQLVTVQRWLDALGHDTIERYPTLAVLRVWTMLVDGDLVRVEAAIEAARGLLESRVADAQSALLVGSLQAATALTAIANGDVGAAVETIEDVVSRPRRYEQSVLVTNIHGICLTWRGHHKRAIVPLETAAVQAPEQGEHLIAATSVMFLAINACSMGDHIQARHLATRALDYAAEHHLGEYHQMALAHSILGRALVLVDDGDAVAQGERGIQLARRSNQPIMLAFALISHADIVGRIAGDEDAADVTALLSEARQLLGRGRDPGSVLTFLAMTEARFGAGASHTGGTRRQHGVVEEHTERELTVLRLLPSTLPVREIASELYISHNTVKGHVKAIYRKLGVNERSLAVQRARELHLL